RVRTASSGARTLLLASSSAVSTSMCAYPSEMYTSKPPATSPYVGVIGSSTTPRGVLPVHVGAVHVPTLFANALKLAAVGVRPFDAPNPITGMLIAAACGRFSLSGRLRPTESGVVSRPPNAPGGLRSLVVESPDDVKYQS